MTELPERNEIVICKITKVLDYGVFAELLEYEGVQGFVHISNVASSWIKNIRNFVKEGQIRAAQVINIDTSKNQIDMSFNKVQPRLQRKKIEEWKQLKRCQKLMEVMAKENKAGFDEVWEQIADPLLEKSDTLYDAFQKILINGEMACKGIPKKWVKPLIETVKKNVELPTKTIKGIFQISCPGSDGVEVIKKGLVKAEKEGKNADVEFYYVGSGKYQIKVSALDFKVAERALKNITETAEKELKKAKCNLEFNREE